MREVMAGDLSHTTLTHIKNFLSGVFRFAIDEEILTNIVNPMSGVKLKQLGSRPRKFDAAAYTLDDVNRMMEEISNEDAQDLIVLMSLTGLRQGEARALRWSDWNEKDGTLSVARSVWRVHVGPTKSEASEGDIPVLPLLSDLLTKRRDRVNPRKDSYIFANGRGGPLDFHNIENRIIRPALKDTAVKWRGFHGFRRGLASNLFSLGIGPSVIASILRHGDVSVTLKHYVKSPNAEAKAAMERLETAIKTIDSTVTVGKKS